MNLEKRDWFDRETIAHELSHQIMWQESGISSTSIVGKVLTGRLHLYHSSNLLSNDPTHPLIEGWAEYMASIFDNGRHYQVAMLRDNDIKAPATVPLGPPPINNRGEFCEGAFANGLLDVYQSFIGGSPVAESNDGRVSLGWITNDVRQRWKSAIWDPLQDLSLKSKPTTRDFLAKLKSMHPADWHLIAPHLHKWNMMMDPPTISAITPPSGPAASPGTVTITGTEFAAAAETTATVGGAAVGVNVVSSTQIELSIPAGPAGDVAIVVTTKAGDANTQFTRT
ncbi:hypothetical protein A7982_13885 [Minicystis rosea]|nr:hypothetical protein A7982_13885 [Minicystis rosea]